MTGFDPYLVWLDIPLHERPPTYYRLLGLRPLESDPQVIASSAQRVIAHVSQFRQSEHADACNRLLGELTAARDCLTNPGRKQAYDSGISQSFSPAGQAGPIPTQSPSRNYAAGPEQPLPGPGQTPYSPTPTTGERTLPGAPRIPTTPERQISQSPPVPQTNAPPSNAPHIGAPQTQNAPSSIQPATPPGVPLSPGITHTPGGEQQVASPGGVPQSVQPTTAPSPGSFTPPPSLNPPTGPQQDSPAPQPTTPPTSPPASQPPAWASATRTGQVETVVAGQSSPQDVNSSRTNKGRQLRRAQQTQSAYMLVGIAMALIVFFFGAVLLLALYLGNQ